ncbi:MAG: PA domain-containing protein [Pyrinomonadaceae bacterium]
MQSLVKKLPAFGLALILTLVAAAEASAQANIVILNGDAAGVGFNDPTAVAPVGGNSGTTLGQQRMIAAQAAANIWGASLVSGPTITIRGVWSTTLACTSTSGTLASAGNNSNIFRNFSGAEPGFWYGNALANALSNLDRNGPTTHEINANFNLNLGTPGCFDNAFWYYGLDNNHGPNGIDLVNVMLHEFGHGLGFQTFTNKATGEQVGDDTNGRFPSIYDRYLFDNTAGKSWPQMTNAERAASAINTGNLVWVGPQVLADVPNVVSGTPRLRVNSPAGIAGNYPVGTASFGPGLSPAGTTADVAPTIPADGCSAITNSVSGKIALIDRGNCNFTVKTKNAQNAGASAVVIVDNVSAPTPPGMGGTDNTILIPAVSITQANGNTIKAQLTAGVNATLLADASTLAGTDANRRPLMYAPNPLEGGSSVSHWDLSLLPNQVMEPNVAGDLLHVVVPPRDLTYSLFRDLGWNTGAPAPPMILLEEGTIEIGAVLDSVTRERGPFTVLTSHNFSSDGRRRLILFTSDLGLAQGNTTGLSVEASGISLPVENAGPFSDVGGTSYVIVRLLDLPPNTYALTVRLNNRSSTNAPTIRIIP